MARFVILTHDWPAPHWALLVVSGGVLRAWRLLSEPRAGADVPAEPNAPHRLFYLDYEGPVSGGRGSVSRWDRGTCEWYSDGAGRAEVDLRGEKLAGLAVMQRTEEGWTFRLTGSPG